MLRKPNRTGAIIPNLGVVLCISSSAPPVGLTDDLDTVGQSKNTTVLMWRWMLMPTPLFSYSISWGANFLALNAQKLGKLSERRSFAAFER